MRVSGSQRGGLAASPLDRDRVRTAVGARDPVRACSTEAMERSRSAVGKTPSPRSPNTVESVFCKQEAPSEERENEVTFHVCVLCRIFRVQTVYESALLGQAPGRPGYLSSSQLLGNGQVAPVV